MAAAVEACLLELDLAPKLVSITGDNAANNETMVSDLYHRLARIRLQGKQGLRFKGLDSYIR